MADDDWDGEETWGDEEDDVDEDDVDEEEAESCPECGAAIFSFTDKCPSCGYWLSAADRRAMSPGMSKPLWLRMTAAVVLLAFLLSLLGIGFALF